MLGDRTLPSGVTTTSTTKAKVKPYALALACLPRPGLAVNLTLAELLTKNEDRVERRAQLVRHVGEEFGFVF